MPRRVKEQLALGLRYAANGHAQLRDAASSDNKSQPIHRWVPWIAGFSAQFVQDAIDAFLPRRNRDDQVVLDPFAGVGTTLVEALKAGRHAIGHEINPFAALAARAKINCVDTSVRTLRSRAEWFRTQMFDFESQVDRRWGQSGDRGLAPLLAGVARGRPVGFRSRVPFFSPPIEAKFLHALALTNELRDPYRSLFRAALGATMVSFSNYTYEPSLSSRPGAGKPLIENADVAHVVYLKLQTIVDDTSLALDQYGQHWKARRREIASCSYFDSTLPSNAASLMVTSPPYMNNYHYVRNTRPQLYWLGLLGDQASLKDYEEQSFGKFWQTVRQGPIVKLTVDDARLRSMINKLRALNPDRGPYGGGGWANYVTTYFNDCERFLAQAKRHLKPGARAVVVVGNSIIQGMEFKVEELLADLAERSEFYVEDVRRVRSKRVGTSIIDSAVRNGQNGPHHRRTQLYDAAVILRA